MMEALEGERVEEGLNGDPLALLRERKVTGYLMISGIDESADAALIAIDGDVIGAEFLSDDGQWLGKEALDRIGHLRNTWIDLFTWDRKSIERVLGSSPKAKIAPTKEDMRSVIEERRKKRLEALRSSRAASEKGRGLSGLFAKVTEQVKDLESDARAPPSPSTPEQSPPAAAARPSAGEPAEVAALRTFPVGDAPARPREDAAGEPEAVRQLHEAAKVVVAALEPAGTGARKGDRTERPTLLSKPTGARPTSAEAATPTRKDEEKKSFEEAISDGIDELKKLSRELDGLLEK